MKRILFFVCGLAIAAAAHAQIISIPYDYPTIQLGINAAYPGDTILVEPGTYVENIDFTGKNIVVASRFIVNRDTSLISQTIIDGNQEGSVVTLGNNEDPSAVLCGFSIINGHSNHGGGIHICQSNPTLQYLVISDNSAYYSGGGICCGYSGVTIENVIIRNNYALYSGGGIYFYYSSPDLENVDISGCWSDDCGGGIYNESSSCIISRVNISYNQSFKGGGISFKNSVFTMVNSLISNNIAESLGGGIKLENTDSEIINTLISDNSSQIAGGGIFCMESDPVLVNVTLANNFSFDCGGVIYCNDAHISCYNSILWGNLPDEVYFELSTYADQISFSYCSIQNGEDDIITNNNGSVNWIVGNITQDPLFSGIGKAPYSLSDGSPCIDAGTPDLTGLNIPGDDLAGNQRIWDGDGNGSACIDIGPYEYGSMVVGINNHRSFDLISGIKNFPNPFNNETIIEYELKRTSIVTINIFDLSGHRETGFINQGQSAGIHKITWKPEHLPSGFYYFKIQAGNQSIIGKMILINHGFSK